MLALRLLAAVFILVAGASSCLAGQRRDEALVWTPWRPHYVPAGPIAQRLLPYALLAEQSYIKDDYTYRRVKPEPRPCVDKELACPEKAYATARAARILSRWRYVSGRDEAYPCRRTLCGAPLTGLGYQVWARRGAVCTEMVLSFRGTQRGSVGDWLSNLRWVTRVLPVYDEYEQLEDYLPQILADARRDRCYREGVTRLVAVGHSLGGGLAQFAAYSRPNFRVYAFDPSFVTGYYNGLWSIPQHARNARGLKIERVYEDGEVLQYPRYLVQTVVPPSICNPRVVNIRFNVQDGSHFDQHELARFITGLVMLAKDKPAERKPLVDEACRGP